MNRAEIIKAILNQAPGPAEKESLRRDLVHLLRKFSPNSFDSLAAISGVFEHPPEVGNLVPSGWSPKYTAMHSWYPGADQGWIRTKQVVSNSLIDAIGGYGSGMAKIANVERILSVASPKTEVHELIHNKQRGKFPRDFANLDKVAGEYVADFFPELQDVTKVKINNSKELVAESLAQYMSNPEAFAKEVSPELLAMTKKWFDKYHSWLLPTAVGGGVAAGALLTPDTEANAFEVGPIVKGAQKGLKSSSIDLLKGFEYMGRKIIDIVKGAGDHRYVKFDDGTQQLIDSDALKTLVSVAGHEKYVNKFKGESLNETQKLMQTNASLQMREGRGSSGTLEQVHPWTDLYRAKAAVLFGSERVPDLVYVKFQNKVYPYPREYAEFLSRMSQRKDLPEFWKRQLKGFKILKTEPSPIYESTKFKEFGNEPLSNLREGLNG